MGPAFSFGFALLTAGAVWHYLRAWELGRAAELEAAALQNLLDPGAGGVEGDAQEALGPIGRWDRLTQMKAQLATVSLRAQVATSSIPTLALLGTCLGFFYALHSAAQIAGGDASALEMLTALMDGGIATALGATVCGQGVYLVLSQVWALLVAPRVELAFARIDEGLEVVRPRVRAAWSGEVAA
jgi:hypothetical protein